MRFTQLRIFIIAVLLCGLSDSLSWGRAQDAVTGAGRHEVCVGRYDGHASGITRERRWTTTNAALNARTGQRIGVNRPTRLIPTHGGKPGEKHFSYTVNHPFNHKNFVCALMRLSACPLGVRVSSPRSYYVIVLGRFLC